MLCATSEPNKNLLKASEQFNSFVRLVFGTNGVGLGGGVGKRERENHNENPAPSARA